ncbi:MAG: GTPase ObgE [Bacilli bacterium]|nr:GTPase ObgE [Bacilli bacterium]MDD4282384.1 GTPase ObgE [Bacilli bacterium]MDD4718989.1 GTPase ObgE [Bacilli bacterium]
MFVDEVVVEVTAGDGGNGCMAFRREKFVDMGGPYGGNGGRGSNVVFKVDEGLNTLVDLRYQRLIKGKRGSNGEGKGKHGKGAEDVIIKVPLGTVITDIDTGLIIADLTHKDDEVIVANGGRGGRGNIAFATRANPAPEIAENGEPGEVRKIKVELKLLADIGLVGMPSVGKSTLISKISAAKPKIAAYHFTTLSPNLGVVKTLDNRSFVVADLPGLIEGASLGEGLGDQFLRHIERTRVIAHIVDMSGIEGRDPYDDYLIINKELMNFNPKILDKPQIIIANKMDIIGALDNLEKFKEKVKVPIYPISAINNEGLDKVLIEMANMLDKIEKQPLYEEEKFESHVLYKYQEEEPFTIIEEPNAWVIKGEEVEKLVRMTRFSSEDAVLRFSHKLRKMGIDDKLKELGVEEGDTIRILDFEFEYKL